MDVKIIIWGVFGYFTNGALNTVENGRDELYKPFASADLTFSVCSNSIFDPSEKGLC